MVENHSQIKIQELSVACAEFGLGMELVYSEDDTGPFLILTGGLPEPETIQAINRRLFQIEPRIRKILLDIASDRA